ncbi:epithelial discoidin domain-containing receptor 1 isoform X1 [Pelobates cultripes]|uniref:receptor protein-tyrosine kinase n=1 Tax=Pelobates cultripes TaxID=61616 RepID=A0AAD1T392_PELCU|nr:epithelial discoidin domain-containing receptor 1 isoform X1 [Pelobates cultripes]
MKMAWATKMASYVLSLFLFLAPCTAEPDAHFDPSSCRYALGMQDRTIPDEDITASSAWSDSTEAKHSRLESHDGDGAWCPAESVYPNNDEYLQVDLRKLYFVTLVGTQGRDGGGLGKEFARHYQLRYSRDGYKWAQWKDRWGNEVIAGNENTQDLVLKDLGPPLIARYVRFYPMADRVMSVCLRVELYGCVWQDGLRFYTSPPGNVMHLPSMLISLNDSTYDGLTVGGLQYGGLGQLTDGVVGADDFTQHKEQGVWPGYDYVGWNKDSFQSDFLEMEFEFDALRTFTYMRVHCNNMRSQRVQIFRQVTCYFKRSLHTPWDAQPVNVSLALDIRDPSARSVTIPLNGRAARILRCHYFFSSQWLLFSEISFLSEIMDSSEPEEPSPLPPPKEAPPIPTVTSQPQGTSQRVTTAAMSTENLNGQVLEAGSDIRMNQPVAKDDSGDTFILIGCLCIIILLLVVVIILILWRQRWKKLLGKAQRHHSDSDLTARLSLPSDTVVINNTQNPLPPRHGNRYERILTSEGEYQEPSHHPRAKIATLPPTPESAALLLNNPAYALLLSTYNQPITEPSGVQAKPLNSQDGGYRELESPKLPVLCPASVPHYAEADIVTLQGVTGSNTYAVPALTADSLASKELPLSKFPRGHLLFKEKLGEGQFGEVHLCEVMNPHELPTLQFPFNMRKGRSLLVAVKLLRSDANKNARNDFLKELKILSRLSDPHIIRLLGACLDEDPLCMITEYMENGDLNQFLSAHQLGEEDESPEGRAGPPCISYPSLLQVALQICSGMKYLSSLNFVHRDLASRNCLVGENLTIKIADFGMSRNLYAGDYYRIQGRAVLPIRWMAWECILMGKFTTASDVWAFGITLWEILMLCKEQPYGELSDEDVIENAGEVFRDSKKQIYLSCPVICPTTLYELMLQCWARDCRERPSFQDIYASLSSHAVCSTPLRLKE